MSSVADDLTQILKEIKIDYPFRRICSKGFKNYLLKIKLKYKNNNSNKKKWLFQTTNTHISRQTYYNRLKKVFARKVDINIR